jgi:heptosyltransferase-2
VWATKRWPYFPELARRLAPSARIAVVGGADDAPLAREIQNAAGQADTVDATGKLSLLASAELIGRAAALVTNDSLPQHIASAMETPTVTLFGPTVPAFGFGPLAARSVTLGHTALECRPCHHHGPRRCPLGHWRCMTELAVERVADAVIPFL